ncbi:MAG: acyl-CoA thioesterase [Planctomycetes bacterium]|nr:acyl-CoA thioesterase [Planctomycetota bacterium]
MPKTKLPDRDPAIRAIMLPRDTNERGTIFGGVILAHLDMAGAVEARKHGRHRFVTVAMNEVVFRAPVFVGDLVSYYTRTTKIGRTSVTVQVNVEATRKDGRAEAVPVTQATIVYVAVDEGGRPIPVRG